MGSTAALKARQPRRVRIQRDVFVSGVESFTDAGGGNARITFYVMRDAPGGGTERHVLDDCLVMPRTAIPDGIGKALLAIGRRIVAREDGIEVGHG